MTAQGIEDDFTVASTDLLNRYFREYHLEHGQGGTHTLQRNLIQLFNFLPRKRGHPTPYTGELNRYAEVKGPPRTLGAQFVSDLLEVTGGGAARDFEDARDHVMIRILRSDGIRRSEVLGMVMHTLPADVIRSPPQAMPVGLIVGTLMPVIANSQVRAGASTSIALRASMLHLILLRWTTDCCSHYNVKGAPTREDATSSRSSS